MLQSWEPTPVPGKSHSTPLNSYSHSSSPVPPSSKNPRPENPSATPNFELCGDKFPSSDPTKGKSKVSSSEVPVVEGVDDDDDDVPLSTKWAFLKTRQTSSARNHIASALEWRELETVAPCDEAERANFPREMDCHVTFTGI
ncbi:hypothetical protein HAX54_051108 [Datura stramonium]|uniref:Uncharacterized protein n=1 Tax=Datura stramonium TaxID=4076 RepID=A0ABS8SZD1_DATST|nr:hypothetical protein [Datura stramonium]